MYEVIEEFLSLRLLNFDHFAHLALTSFGKVENVYLRFVLLSPGRAWIPIAIKLEIWQHGAHISLLFLIPTRVELGLAACTTSIMRTVGRLSDAVCPGSRRLIKRDSVHIHAHN